MACSSKEISTLLRHPAKLIDGTMERSINVEFDDALRIYMTCDPIKGALVSSANGEHFEGRMVEFGRSVGHFGIEDLEYLACGASFTGKYLSSEMCDANFQISNTGARATINIWLRAAWTFDPKNDSEATASWLAIS